METNFSLFFRTDASVLCLFLFLGCILMVIFGRFIRNKFFSKDEQESKGGVNSLLGALFGLWGFLLAFTFGSSSSRFDTLRNMMVDETNSIRNAVLRSEVLPDSIQQGLKIDLKKYLDARLDYYKYATDLNKLSEAKQKAADAAKELWNATAKASNLPNLAFPGANMLASLSAMFDVAAKTDSLLQSGVPEPIMYLLFFLALTISFIGGFTTPVIKTKEWIVIAGFLLLACIIIYITLDLGRPLRGFIQPEVGENKLINLEKMF